MPRVPASHGKDRGRWSGAVASWPRASSLEISVLAEGFQVGDLPGVHVASWVSPVPLVASWRLGKSLGDAPLSSVKGIVPHDLTIASAKTAEEVLNAKAPPQAVEQEEEPSLLKRLPFVEQTDAIAGALGLPQSQEVEKLGRELLKEPQRLLGGPLQPAGTSTFQSPLVSFAYERGWRRSFASSGFPGPDEEFRLAQDFLREGTGLLGDTLLDASCGSGLFSRRFAASGDYSTVVALDFSESMLRQVDDFARQEIGPDYAQGGEGKTALQLVRADIARLPFESGSLGGVHAGAAIHCWPNPELAVAEVSRVLRPGGVFVLTTFMPRGPLRAMGTNRNPYKFWTEEELRSLTSRCGLSDFQAIIKDPAFIMVRVKKPAASTPTESA
ncbi:unnamed protein product [Symbiodinium sp. CCMP2456]|nr:unnamed protein product [Symbiodinium sp. CCMP2456]